MPTYSEILRRPVAQPLPCTMDMDWGDVACRQKIIKPKIPTPSFMNSPKEDPLPAIQTPPSDATNLRLKRDRFASEATRIPYIRLKYIASLRKKFQPRGFRKWCEMDFAFNYARYAECLTLSCDNGKWAIYENGNCMHIGGSCIETFNWMQTHMNTQEFPFPLWVFQLRTGTANPVCDSKSIQTHFEEELIREMREEEEQKMEAAAREAAAKSAQNAAPEAAAKSAEPEPASQINVVQKKNKCIQTSFPVSTPPLEVSKIPTVTTDSRFSKVMLLLHFSRLLFLLLFVLVKFLKFLHPSSASL